MRIAILLLLATLTSNKVIAQTDVNELREKYINNKNALSAILGTWYSGDSLNGKIDFIQESKYFTHIKGIQHGVSHYMFQCDGDSMSVSGTAPNWPPYDCTIFLHSKDTLEIKFYQYFSERTTDIIYQRRR